MKKEAASFWISVAALAAAIVFPASTIYYQFFRERTSANVLVNDLEFAFFPPDGDIKMSEGYVIVANTGDVDILVEEAFAEASCSSPGDPKRLTLRHAPLFHTNSVVVEVKKFARLDVRTKRPDLTVRSSSSDTGYQCVVRIDASILAINGYRGSISTTLRAEKTGQYSIIVTTNKLLERMQNSVKRSSFPRSGASRIKTRCGLKRGILTFALIRNRCSIESVVTPRR